MITGYNTDVEYGGRTYHVQTEDRGADNPVVESLIYCQGEILDTRRTEYSRDAAGGVDEKALTALLERQHRRLIREIRNGLWAPEGPRLVGEEFLTDRTFDAVVAEFLTEDPELEPVHLVPEGTPELVEGQAARLQLRALIRGDTDRPSVGTHISVRQVAPGAAPVVIGEGETDKAGLFSCELVPPESPSGPAALIVVSDAPGGGQTRLTVRKPS